VQAIKEADLRIGQTVAVFGAGPIGLLIILAAKAAGASKIIALDLSESRLEKAKAVGATHIINPGEQNPIQAIQQIIPEGADVTFEAAGAESTFHQSIKATKPRGVVVIVSLFNGPVRFNPMFLTISGVRITSSAAYEPSSFQTAIDLIASGAINAKSIITNRIELDHIVEAGFQALTNDKSQSKILVKLSGES
ncbi:MAG TPA: zinc-binding dehydrogenase, partial [Chondromyces sp.]|nr:zinc-binding dehydrogenase [Chondromyces sp.]